MVIKLQTERRGVKGETPFWFILKYIFTSFYDLGEPHVDGSFNKT